MEKRPLRILLVDDDEDEFILTRDLLGDIVGRRFELDWISEWEDGVRAVLEGGYDAYLIDYRLGAHDGIELLRRVRREGGERAMIILTGQGDDAIDQEAMRAGASDYLVKGEIDPETMGRAIRYAIERNRIQSQLRLQAEILKNVHDAVFYVNSEGEVLDWNEGAARTFEIDAASAIGTSIEALCPAEAGHPFLDRILPAVRRDGIAEEMVRCRLASGREIYIHAKVTPMALGSDRGFVFCAHDITEQKKLEAELLRISEEEQRRIGQDIHDDLCSQLSGIGCLTKVLETRLRTHRDEEAELLRKVSDMVSNAGMKAREIARGLVPSVLENQGLPGALEELATRSRDLFGVHCRTSLQGTGESFPLGQDTNVQLFRIAQEAVANAIKHSDAEAIQIVLANGDGFIRLEVSDDGKGLTSDPVSAGMGLLTMRRRAEILQADFAIHASPGEGTTITCAVPLPVPDRIPA